MVKSTSLLATINDLPHDLLNVMRFLQEGGGCSVLEIHPRVSEVYIVHFLSDDCVQEGRLASNINIKVDKSETLWLLWPHSA